MHSFNNIELNQACPSKISFKGDLAEKGASIQTYKNADKWPNTAENKYGCNFNLECLVVSYNTALSPSGRNKCKSYALR